MCGCWLLGWLDAWGWEGRVDGDRRAIRDDTAEVRRDFGVGYFLGDAGDDDEGERGEKVHAVHV